MKRIFIAIAFLISLSARADMPANETVAVTSALLKNPMVVQTLWMEQATRLANLEMTETTKGVTEYNMMFERDGMSTASTVYVVITEDSRNAASGAQPVYTSKVKMAH